ncbi:MAG: thiol reductant ABC exporter subunit CydC [Negativicutes bacterium]|nr:thiol reductant ABC exporter subunit CydC [Negativicutes bacterium]
MKIFWRLCSIIAPAWPAMLGASLLALLTITANVGLMAAAAFLIASAALHPPLAVLSPAIVGVRFFGLARAVCRYLERWLSHDATFRLLSRIRVWCYMAIEPLVPAGLAKLRSGDVFSSIVHDVETLQYFYLRVLLPPSVAVLTLLGMAAFLWPFGMEFPALTGVAFVTAGLLLPLALWRLEKSAGGRLPAARANLTVAVADSIQGMRDLAAFGQTGRQADRAAAASEDYSRMQGRSAMVAALGDAAGSLMINLTVVGAVLVALPLIESGQLDGVYLAVLALSIQSSFEAILPLAAVHRSWDESAAAGRLFSLLDSQPAVTGATDSPPLAGGLEIRDLSFHYQAEGPQVLDRVSFSVPVGARLAIVGPSGAGKSTLVSLLLRFWDYETGSVRLGGQEIRRIQPRLLRDAVGVVPQHAYIFNATFGDNIRLARPEAGDSEVLAAAERAELGPLLHSLPQGLDTLIGENGFGLSGGERRRLAIARALLKNAPFLIVDEPTAGLDSVTEEKIMEVLDESMAGRTTILITHRLLGLAKMDEILVLDQGRIVEQGRQDQLLAAQGLFCKMWRLQHDVFPGLEGQLRG